jgi:autonomous glycyl radical cofactor GrcA
MLASASRFVQKDIYGMAVTNLSITKKYTPEIIRALVEGYFEMGGTQLQITVTDRETLLDAQQNPDAHRDLIVRVGGYSEYFNRLTPDLKKSAPDINLPSGMTTTPPPCRWASSMAYWILSVQMLPSAFAPKSVIRYCLPSSESAGMWVL